jgi:predicted aspartyl protease
MRGLYRFAFALSVFVGCAAPCAAADDKPCNIVRAASLEMSTDAAGAQDVPMTIGGQTINLLIDTGGVDSMLTESVVETLKLEERPIYRGRVILFGGFPIDSQTTAHDIDFGGLKAPTMFFMIMPDGHLPKGIGGTLAPDVMRAYDDEFDFAGAKFNLFLRDHCKANMAYWTKDDHAEIPFDLDRVGHINFSVELDGKEIDATLDTGSSRSMLNFEEAEDLFGFKESDSQLKPLATTSTGHVYKFSFKTLSFGGVSVTNPDLMLVSRRDERMPGGPTMLLGMGILRQLHMYIAYKEEKLYVTAASAH